MAELATCGCSTDEDSGCALDEQELAAQLERYRAAGRGSQPIERTARRIALRLAPEVERGLVEQLLAVERECCPFFTLTWQSDSRRLTISVVHAEHEPALAMIAAALRAHERLPDT